MLVRCRVVRRNASATVKVPWNQEMLVEPEGLLGAYMARIVSTLQDNMSSSNTGGAPPLVVEKSPLEPLKSVSSPRGKFVTRSDGNAFDTIRSDSKNGSGECLPELPEGSLLATTTSHMNDLQAASSSLPVENRIDNQVDTIYTSAAQRKEGQVEIESRNKIKQERKESQKGTQVLGYVPIQIVNLSLVEEKMGKKCTLGQPPPYKVTELKDKTNMT